VFAFGSNTRVRSKGEGPSKDHLRTSASGPLKKERPMRICTSFRRFISVGQNFRA
jgi:hypothetical protein